MSNALRNLPAVHEPLAILARLHPGAPSALAAACVRDELNELRARLQRGEALDGELEAAAIAAKAAARLGKALQPTLRRVVNATGILLHTNLGRAPLAEAAARAAFDAGRGCLNLEMDLASGRRTSRPDAVRGWLVRLLGCGSATVVNNNAAATVIALRALAKDREVIVSRGELVEIGGSFRIPEIMAVSGATLREVGTTNITRARDYEAAVTDRTAALLRVHASNYRIVGHTEAPTLDELVALGRAKNLLVIDDVGSGAVIDYSAWGLADEPMPRASLAAGADLVLFSGDKLLGGPQAGILAGRADLIAKIEKDPLMRAFRVDKMTLAALEATLRLLLDEATRTAAIPVLRMASVALEELARRAEALLPKLQAVPGLSARTQAATAYVGGGSLPGQGLPSLALAVVHREIGPNALARRLRAGEPAVVARVEKDETLLDLRTVPPEEDQTLADALRAAVTSPLAE